MALTRVSGNLLTSTAVTAGIYGGSGNTVSLTVDAQGRVTAAANVVSSGGGITYTTVKTANYTAVADDGVQTNTTAGAFTVTLPATPANGDQVFVVDSFNTWGTNNLTIGRNGSTIEGVAQDLVCDITGVSVQCVYNGTTWDIYAQVGGAGGSVVSGPASSTDNAIARFDLTTGKLLQDSTGILTDAGALSGLTTIDATGNITTNGGKFSLKSASTEYGSFSTASGDATLTSAASGYLKLVADGALLIGSASGAEVFRGSSSGFRLANSLGVGGASPSGSGAGIIFPATQSASSDANTLDDYEEGTWTPNITSSGGGSGSGTDKEGRYTKIGRMVYITGHHVLTNKTGINAGNVRIENLPFTSSASDAAGVSFNTINSLVQTGIMTVGGVDTNYITVNNIISNGTQTALTVSELTNVTGFYFSAVYSI